MPYLSEVNQLDALDNTCHFCEKTRLCPSNTLSIYDQQISGSATVQGERLGCGDHLFWPGKPLRFIYFIQSGSIKTYVTNANGDIQITGFYYKGDVIGLNASDSAIENYGAMALEPVTVCKIPLAEFEKKVSQSPALSRACIKCLSKEIKLKHRMILVLAKMTVEQRVAYFLISMSILCGVQGQPSAPFNLSMMYSDIANYLGVAVETISRMFKKYKDKGIISIERRKVSIEDIDALYDISANQRL